ncbi:two-component system sensor histidine kinase MprB [Streptosporangium becharense]|uniref:histidine kinase n=1 Tax=Streptosporangium becharense TaxID=1816182 RepID=A0A7W9IG98_9ACTN|nr:HAMP domain-containing sensor histidine kinase [Streptosporangium becharense]MBB2908850.1 two-component system sensor histidine kinase MprB [Streptosporangium becharense]MBB5820132.1 two-component system sensor histidine kinase MprB [Streptosporangium becharense]
MSVPGTPRPAADEHSTADSPPATDRRPAVVRWWRRHTLRARLTLLVTAAVAVGMVAVSVFAWVTVRRDTHRMIMIQLETGARTIAAQPQLWSTAPVPPHAARPGDDRPRTDGGRRRPEGLGPRWQLLDRTATVVSDAAGPLPVTAGARRVATGQSARHQEQVVIGRDHYQMLSVPAAGGGAVQIALDVEDMTRTMTRFSLLLVLACAVGVAGAALLGRAVARAGLAPVGQLTETVEHLTVTMNLGEAIPVSGDDEVARLARSVNTLLAAIDEARRAQRALVEDAGHELRTPLTSIRTNVELLLAVERQPELAHRLPPEERAKLLCDLEAQVRELATLTTELVELAREETTREAPEPVDLADVVNAAISRVRMRAPGLRFTTDLQPVRVRGRPGELERMVLNVLDNAAKWSPPDATVRTVLGPDEATGIRLTITDEGPGIDPADLPHVFDRFYRAQAARSMPGSGLGLAIVAQTAAQHGGDVTAEPHHPHGTRVTIRLPRLGDPGPSPAVTAHPGQGAQSRLSSNS